MSEKNRVVRRRQIASKVEKFILFEKRRKYSIPDSRFHNLDSEFNIPNPICYFLIICLQLLINITNSVSWPLPWRIRLYTLSSYGA